ncbi:Bromodomain-containing protein, partial [Baffinella frigidus]
FNVPVDPVALKIPDYLEKVKRPMDLGTVKERLSKGYYASADQFQDDINLVWDNALLFNAPGTMVHEGARALKD